MATGLWPGDSHPPTRKEITGLPLQRKRGERMKRILIAAAIAAYCFSCGPRYLTQFALAATNVRTQAQQTDKPANKTEPPLTADSDTGPDVQAVLARTEELNQAFLRSDMLTLGRIIADDCLQITQNGAATKAEWLAPFHTGAKRFDNVKPPKPPEWRRVRLYGDAAIVTSAGEIAMVEQGEPRTYWIFNTRTWVKRSGQWYLVLAQNTRRDERESGAK